MNQKSLTELEKDSKNAIIKRRIITHYIYNDKSTIPALANELGLSVPTTTKIIEEMCDCGYINDYGKEETSRGRQPHIYGLNAESGYFVGVEILQDAINIGLINYSGDIIVLKKRIPYKFKNSLESLNELCRMIQIFINNLSIDKSKILNINVNIPGRVNSRSGYSFSNFNFDKRPLTELMSEFIGYKVTIDNDTRAMAYGEYLRGHGNGKENFIFVNVSWELGIGLIIDGKLYYGKSGFSGDFGHIRAYDNEILCHCGKKGCLETEASGSALHRLVLERIRNGETSILSNRISSQKLLMLEDIISAVNDGDVLSIDIIEEIGLKLGKQIAGLINIFNPELVVIGGSLSQTGDYIIQPLKTAIRKHSLNLINKDTEFLLSKLGDEVGVLGACLLARSNLFEKNK